MKKFAGIIAMLFLLLTAPAVLAEEHDEDWEIMPGVEGEKAFNLLSGILATVLFALTAIAYNRTKRSRLLYVSAAFLLFAVKGYIASIELFHVDWLWIDPVSAVLNFAILLCFFQGLLKK